MLWDESFVSWNKLGIQGQPAWVLFDKNGVARFADYGEVSEESITPYLERLV